MKLPTYIRDRIQGLTTVKQLLSKDLTEADARREATKEVLAQTGYKNTKPQTSRKTPSGTTTRTINGYSRADAERVIQSLLRPYRAITEYLSDNTGDDIPVPEHKVRLVKPRDDRYSPIGGPTAASSSTPLLHTGDLHTVQNINSEFDSRLDGAFGEATRNWIAQDRGRS